MNLKLKFLIQLIYTINPRTHPFRNFSLNPCQLKPKKLNLKPNLFSQVKT